MATPQIGVTHDVILHVPELDLHLGLNSRLFTFRVSLQSPMIDRIGGSDPSGVDTSPWRSFVQRSFHQGAGQYFWSSPHANGGFAESHMMDISAPSTIQGITMRDDPSWSFGENQQPAAHITTAPIPQVCLASAIYESAYQVTAPIFVMEMSNRPYALHHKSAYAYTNNPNWPTTPEGTWNMIPTCFSASILGATVFSGMPILAVGDSGLRVVDNNVAIIPRYSTVANLVVAYDDKLWRANKGQVAYLNPAFSTVDAVWSAYYNVGNPNVSIVSSVEFAGRLYFGKPDGLYVFDAGRVYVIQSYAQAYDETNFKTMVPHRGALYYNIGNALYRLTAAGAIEQIRTPWFDDPIVSGASVEDELILTTGNTVSGRIGTWIFNAESGGIRKWIGQSTAHSTGYVPVVTAVRGQVFLAPFQMTQAGVNYEGKFMASVCDRRYLYRGMDNTLWGSYMPELITSSFDMGLPEVDKVFNRVVIRARHSSTWQSDIYYGNFSRMTTRIAGRAGLPPPDLGQIVPVTATCLQNVTHPWDPSYVGSPTVAVTGNIKGGGATIDVPAGTDCIVVMGNVTSVTVGGIAMTKVVGSGRATIFVLFDPPSGTQTYAKSGDRDWIFFLTDANEVRDSGYSGTGAAIALDSDVNDMVFAVCHNSTYYITSTLSPGGWDFKGSYTANNEYCYGAIHSGSVATVDVDYSTPIACISLKSLAGSGGPSLATYPNYASGVAMYPTADPVSDFRYYPPPLAIQAMSATFFPKLDVRFDIYSVVSSIGATVAHWRDANPRPKVMISTAASWTGNDVTAVEWVGNRLLVHLDSVASVGAYSNRYVVHIMSASNFASPTSAQGYGAARFSALSKWWNPTIEAAANALATPAIPSRQEGSWTYLGTMSGESERFEFALPTDPAKDMMLKISPRQIYPTTYPWELASIELEYLPIGKRYRRVEMAVDIMQKVELKNLTIEENITEVVSTLFSCAGSGKPYVVEVLYPEHATMRALVQVMPPGANVPVYSDSGIIESDINLRFEEV